ncbi:MAG: cytochrome-c peroxidase [Zoogloeaceae bacterium]|nr:cytochrome-c peroxidase [Zoogloeaceae bacterium]
MAIGLGTLMVILLTGYGYTRFLSSPNQTGAAVEATLDASVHQAVPAARLDEPLSPLRAPTGLDEQKVALGRQLFHDPRLSKDNSISCASCHDLARGGVDRQSRSIGVGGQLGEVNAPTVYNSSLNFRQFWDGRVATLEEQAGGPITNPVEMASTWEEALSRLQADKAIAAQFRAIYNSAPTAATVQNAIAEFERSLITPARMDRWLLGEADAITAQELEGYRVFRRHGCVACHQGENVGGNLFQRFGVMQDYFAGRKVDDNDPDLGRFRVTKREEDRFVFKVPSLRNVALTPPYFHDASAATLEEAVTKMGRYQLGVDLPPEDIQSIVRFLHTLTGEQLQ